MKTICKSLNVKPAYPFDKKYDYNDIIFFDIETTGFSPETTVLYLIGCIYYENNSFHQIQWFADDKNSEFLMLKAFFQLLNNHKILIHFNGTGFDIPYILKKCRKYNLKDYNFDKIISIDIYKNILPYKKLLKTENLKQKTIEKFLGINRKDTYTGGELIKVYGNFLKKQSLNDSSSEELLETLLLHNEDDIRGMLTVSNILCYSDLFCNKISVQKAYLEESYLNIKFNFDTPIPKRVSYGNNTYYLNVFNQSGIIKVKLYKNELKFFYPNYKDYYYLPQEDTAIHKSIAFYVDKDYRTKAKAANCYSKKSGAFVPQTDTVISPYFKIDYYDKITYIEVSQDFLNDIEKITLYAEHILSIITA